MYLFFPTFRLNLVFAVNCFSFLSLIQDDAKVEFTALKRSLEPADNGISVKKHQLPVLTLKLTACAASSFMMNVCVKVSKKCKVLHQKERSPAKYLRPSPRHNHPPTGTHVIHLSLSWPHACLSQNSNFSIVLLASFPYPKTRSSVDCDK